MKSICLQRVRRMRPPPKPDRALVDFDEMRQRNNDNTATADKSPTTILPNVIMHDKVTGVPRFAQDVWVATDQQASIATVPWKEWLRGRVA